MDKFNSGGRYIYHCGEEALRRNGVSLIVNKRFQNAVLGCNLKDDRMISVCFQDKPFNTYQALFNHTCVYVNAVTFGILLRMMLVVMGSQPHG